MTGLVSGQGLIISPGAKLFTSGGNLIIKENLINNGTLTDLEGTITFAGINQIINGLSNTAFNNLTITSGSTTTIQSPQKATGIVLVNGALNSNGFLTLISTAAKTALVNGSGTGEIFGNVTMERYLSSGFGYKYLSSPFQAALVDEFSDDIDLASSSTTIYDYVEDRLSSGWVNYKFISNVLFPLRGYAVNFGSVNDPNTLDLSGIVNNGTQSIILYNNNRVYTKGFNLVGNPYPSPIDWNAASGWTKTYIDDALYFFKAGAINQYEGNYSTLIDGISSDGLASYIIPSMQAFFVHVKDGGYPVTGTLQMDNNVRVINQSQAYIGDKGDNGTPLVRFTASFSDNILIPDFAVTYFDPKSNMEFDGQLDALKLMNSDINVPSFYFVTPGDINLSIYALPPVQNTFCIVPLGIKIKRDGYVVIKIRDIDPGFSNMRISISDMVKGTDQELLSEKEFRVFLTSGEYKNRFFLNMSDILTAIPKPIPEQEDFTIYYNRNALHTTINEFHGSDATLLISNLLGQTLLVKKIPDRGYHVIDKHLPDGIYIATLVSGGFRSSKNLSAINR